ncbi:MAG TPA: tetratricopeptide repeat protein [Gemmatimonadota bacterium]|nr:tetratricopeptide repeat protein [Gemmatimonadota bacterium]
MSESRPRSYQQFFAELKRRKVFRVMAVYGIVGFVILQVADLVIPALLLPEWTYRLVALILLVGFPIAVVIAWAFEVTPDGIKKTGAAEPAQIEAIVAQPASRRWPAGLLALLGAALLLYGGWWAGRQSGPGASGEASAGAATSEMRLAMAEAEDDDRPTIAVLPFADMSREGDQEYFSDGITEEILNTLAKVDDLKVMARTSAFAFKGENLDMRAVGDSLDARYLVEGSVRKADDQLRITAQLIDAEDGSHLWSESYDRRLENVFEIQTEIAEAIAEELRVPLGLEEGDRLVSPTEDLAAFDLYLAGRARMRQRGQNVVEAVDLFEAAVARDSSWAPAWAGLAEARALLPYYTTEVADSAFWANSLASAERASRRALALDDDNASALVALGNVHRDRWEWDEAEVAYRRALSLDPENVEAHQQYAEFLAYVGRFDEAYATARRALSLDRTPIRLNVAAYTAFMAGLHERAYEYLAEGIEMDPEGNVEQLRTNILGLLAQSGDWTGFREALLELEVDVDSAVPVELADAVRRTWPRGVPPTREFASTVPIPVMAARVYMSLGERDRALESLERYVADRPPFGASFALLSEDFEELRNDPRFEALLAARGLEGVRPQRL